MKFMVIASMFIALSLALVIWLGFSLDEANARIKKLENRLYALTGELP